MTVRSYGPEALGKTYRNESADGIGDLIFEEYVSVDRDNNGSLTSKTTGVDSWPSKGSAKLKNCSAVYCWQTIMAGSLSSNRQDDFCSELLPHGVDSESMSCIMRMNVHSHTLPSVLNVCP